MRWIRDGERGHLRSGTFECIQLYFLFFYFVLTLFVAAPSLQDHSQSMDGQTDRQIYKQKWADDGQMERGEAGQWQSINQTEEVDPVQR